MYLNLNIGFTDPRFGTFSGFGKSHFSENAYFPCAAPVEGSPGLAAKPPGTRAATHTEEQLALV